MSLVTFVSDSKLAHIWRPKLVFQNPKMTHSPEKHRWKVKRLVASIVEESLQPSKRLKRASAPNEDAAQLLGEMHTEYAKAQLQATEPVLSAAGPPKNRNKRELEQLKRAAKRFRSRPKSATPGGKLIGQDAFL